MNEEIKMSDIIRGFEAFKRLSTEEKNAKTAAYHSVRQYEYCIDLGESEEEAKRKADAVYDYYFVANNISQGKVEEVFKLTGEQVALYARKYYYNLRRKGASIEDARAALFNHYYFNTNT